MKSGFGMSKYFGIIVRNSSSANFFFLKKLTLVYPFILIKHLQIVLFLVLLFGFFRLSAQEPVLVDGFVESDSVQLQDIHILNLSTRQGTISNLNGQFRITVSVNDTLIFSGLQFHTLGLIVDEKIVEQKLLRIELKPKIEELSEIELKGHDLDGLFYIDTKRLRDSLPLVADEAVNFSNQGYDDPTSSNYVVPSANILNLVSMVGKKKRKENRKEAMLDQKKKQAPQQLREELGDEVFVQHMGIPKGHIDEFIRFCQKTNMIDLYVEGRIMEVIDIMIKEKDNYRRERILNEN